MAQHMLRRFYQGSWVALKVLVYGVTSQRWKEEVVIAPSRQVSVGIVELCFVFDGILAVRKVLYEG
jgi:hypothetical protein